MDDEQPSPDWTRVHEGENTDIVQLMLSNNGVEALVTPAGRRITPAVWVPAADAERAVQLIEQMKRAVDTPPIGSWLCSCGEISEAQFDRCWKCGKDHAR